MFENLYTTKMSANKKTLQNRFAKIRAKNGRIANVFSAAMLIFILTTMLYATVVMAAMNEQRMTPPTDGGGAAESVVPYLPQNKLFQKGIQQGIQNLSAVQTDSFGKENLITDSAERKKIKPQPANNNGAESVTDKKRIKSSSVSVIAFANTSGGKIVFGVEDKTREVVGIDESVVFSIMDSITNAISDSCEPVIIPDVSLQTIDGKTIIVVEISDAKQRPYYIKSIGVQNGTYIRVAGTTRPADENTIRELMFEGSNKSFDQSICLGVDITEADIDNLCKSLYNTAVDNCFSEEAKHEIKRVTKNTLLSWGVLVEKNGKCHPTNAFALLTGNEAIPSKIQCGVFKGNNRAVFVDRREFTGPIQTQIEEAYQYVLAKINLGANIDGLYRQDMYELPPGSIREIIANAVTHRSYLEPGNVQVALYDDRLEVTSPGMLLNGVTIEKIREGYSKVRNRAIANAFS